MSNLICYSGLPSIALYKLAHPASMTHSSYTAKERAHHGISEGLVRLSVGLEDVKDLLADVEQALQACS